MNPELPVSFPGLLGNLQSGPALSFLCHATEFLCSLSTSAKYFKMLIPPNWRNRTLSLEQASYYSIIWSAHMTHTHGLLYPAVNAGLVSFKALRNGLKLGSLDHWITLTHKFRCSGASSWNHKKDAVQEVIRMRRLTQNNDQSCRRNMSRHFTSYLLVSHSVCWQYVCFPDNIFLSAGERTGINKLREVLSKK